MEMKLDSNEEEEEVIVEIPDADGKNSIISGNHPNIQDAHLHHDPDSGLRSRKKVAEIPKTNLITSTSQQQVDDDPAASQLKPKSSNTEPAISSSSETENDDDDDDDDESVYHARRRKKFKVPSITEISLLICITLVLIVSATINKLEDKEIWSLKLWRWSGLVLAIFCGRLFSEWLFDIVVNYLIQLIEKNFFLTKKARRFLKSSHKSFRVFIWLGLILLTWVLLIIRGDVSRSSDTAKVLNYITRGIASTLVVAGAWVLRSVVVKFLYASFYTERFIGRIRQDTFHRHILQTLSGPPLRSNIIGVQNNRNTLNDESKYLTNSNDEEINRYITSEREAKAAANYIFTNVAKPGYNHIRKKDLLRFMEKYEVDKVLPTIGRAVESGKIDKKSVLNWVVSIYMQSKCLRLSLQDTKNAIKELNKFVTGTLVVVLIILWVILMGFVATEVLLFITSQFLLAVFTFGSTAKSTFEAMIFVFLKHPFDVGDRCVIDGVQVVVEEVSILTTVFLRYDNEKIYYPNSTLATKSISNFNRSPDMKDIVEFNLDVSTSAVNLSALKAKIQTYIDSEPHFWGPDHSVQVREIEDVKKMLKMRLYVTHTINFQNYKEKNDRRSHLVLELGNIFQQLGINYHILPPNEF